MASETQRKVPSMRSKISHLLMVSTFILTVPMYEQRASASLVLTSIGSEVEEEFDDFRGDGFSSSPAATQLDSDTYRATGFSDGNGVFGGEFATGDFARGTSAGAVSTGGAYGFDLGGGNFGVGVQPTGDDFNPGTFTIRISNQTGLAIDGVLIDADGYFFNDQDRSTLWTFAISPNDADYVDFFSIDSGVVAATNPTWDLQPIGGLIPFAVPIPNNADFFVRITGIDDAGSGSRDQFALGRFSVTAVPEPSGVALLALICVAFSRRRNSSAIRHQLLFGNTTK